MNLAAVDSAAGVETEGLTKRYRSVAALQDCTISVPAGSVCALVGPNGAGKTTLLRLLAGLARPTGGRAVVLGRTPSQDAEFLADIGFLAQETPLWRRFTAEDHLLVGARMNRRWDADGARARLREVGVPLDRRVGTLSGGQRAQVALSLALAKRPRVLLLDEPVAALDPLARRHFLGALAEAVAAAEHALTVLISSHLIGDLERVCDHLVLLSASRTQLSGDIESLVSEHKVLTGPHDGVRAIERTHEVVEVTRAARQTMLLVRANGPIPDPAWEVSDVGLEEIVLAYMGREWDAPPRPLHRVGGGR